MFPSGARLSFGHLLRDSDKYKYQSEEYQFVGFDELTHFQEDQYSYLFSRVRRPQVPCLLCQRPVKKNQVDNPQTGFLRYAMLSVNVPPFDNADCRKAVLYAADHEAIQGAWGGPVGGDIATTALPPNVAGYKQADTYGFLADKNGNPDKAKQALTACGQPEGFSTKIAVRGDRPKDVASGEALLSPGATRALITRFLTGPAPGPLLAPPERLGDPTPREREVTALAAEGRSNEEIARKPFLSVLTVRTHIQAALTKLGARDRVQAVLIAHRAGLVQF